MHLINTLNATHTTQLKGVDNFISRPQLFPSLCKLGPIQDERIDKVAQRYFNLLNLRNRPLSPKESSCIIYLCYLHCIHRHRRWNQSLHYLDPFPLLQTLGCWKRQLQKLQQHLGLNLIVNSYQSEMMF